ncbi:MAG: hypothetical protein IJA97_00830 [Clostridia bacterium]|nr:hypothetical protein [Clostridia bacterium]
MAKKRKGIFTRIIEGPERSEDYARKTLPSNRWALGWDLFKTNTGKLVKINLLTILFLFPVFLLFYFRQILLKSQAFDAVFSRNIGIGYPAIPSADLLGVSEALVFRTDLTVFMLLFVLSFYLSVGLAGGFYVMRNLVWTEGVFVASDFWRGVKKNYWVVLKSTLLFVFLFAATVLTIDLCNVQIAVNVKLKWLFIIIKIIGIILAVVLIIAYLYTLTSGVTYKLGFFGLIKNAIILSVGLIPFNLFFAAFACVPFLTLFIEATSIFFALGIMLILLLSVSVFLLIWTNYSQWVFDEVVNDNVAGAKKYRGIHKKGEIRENETFVYKKSALTARPVKPITDTEIEIHALPESYSRADLVRLEESKKLMIEDSERYAEEKLKEIEGKSAVDEFMEGSNSAEVKPEKAKPVDKKWQNPKKKGKK